MACAGRAERAVTANVSPVLTAAFTAVLRTTSLTHRIVFGREAQIDDSRAVGRSGFSARRSVVAQRGGRADQGDRKDRNDHEQSSRAHQSDPPMNESLP